MSFRMYCRWMSQHELLDKSILPIANGLKKFSVKKGILRSTQRTVHSRENLLSNKITAVDRDRITSRSSYDKIFCPTLF